MAEQGNFNFLIYCFSDKVLIIQRDEFAYEINSYLNENIIENRYFFRWINSHFGMVSPKIVLEKTLLCVVPFNFQNRTFFWISL